MIKKILILLLLTLTLYGSSCFAFTVEDIQTISYNFLINYKNVNEDEAFTYINNYDFSSIEQYVNNDNYYLIAYGDTAYNNSNIYLQICICKTKTQKPYVYTYSNNPVQYRINNIDLYYKYVLGLSSNMPHYQTSNYHNSNFDFVIPGSYKMIYTQIDMYNSSYSAIWFAKDYCTPTLLLNNTPFNKQFKILMNIDENTEYIKITDSNNIEIDNIAVLDNSLIGTLNDNINLDIIDDELTIWYYQSGEWIEKRLFNRYKEVRIYDKLYNNSYMSFEEDNIDDLKLTDIYIKDLYKFYNTIYIYNVTNENFDTAQARFMFRNNNTTISNGNINTSNLGSNYEKQFENLDSMINDNNNTDNIIDSITGTITDDKDVDNILNYYFSGDNGNTIIENIGYNAVENPFTTIILNTARAFTNALLDSGDETLSFTINNYTITLHSEDFKLPDGELKTFLTILFNGLLIYEIIKYGFKLYQWINSGRLQNLVNESNRHQYYLF